MCRQHGASIVQSIAQDDLDSVSRWHFAVGGLETQQETLTLGKAILLRRLRQFPTHEQLALSLKSLPVAGAMAQYGEQIIRHELIVDAEYIDDSSRIPPTAEAILAGLRIRTGAEIVCPAVCENSWASLPTSPPKGCRAYHFERVLYAALKPVVARVAAGEESDQREFRGQVNRYAELYAFLGQVISFEDPELEQLFQFCRCLLRILPAPREDQPRELQKFVDVNSVRLVQAARESISPEPGKGVLDHRGGVAGGKPEEVLEPLSEILKLLNDRFGTTFAEEDKQFLETLEVKLDSDAGMAASFAVNTRENARLTFDHKVRDHVQDMIDTNFKFFKQINDKPEFADFLNDLLFDRYAERKCSDDDTK
jgi:hypothetical protein